MPKLIALLSVITAGNKPKRIDEYAGRVNSGYGLVSGTRMMSPSAAHRDE